MSAENKSVIIPVVYIENWPNNFPDCVNCAVLRDLIEGDVYLNIKKKGYEDVETVEVTPICTINENPTKTAPQNGLIKYTRTLQNSSNRNAEGYKMYTSGFRTVTVGKDVVCPADIR
jgi:hypothetical protein